VRFKSDQDVETCTKSESDKTTLNINELFCNDNHIKCFKVNFHSFSFIENLYSGCVSFCLSEERKNAGLGDVSHEL